ncbi:MAG: glycosyltransferase family 4 protein [Ignavibacteria bacterium]|nr:glycosyltransferase family 4 protein [Ignavibacteria bacterium]
MKNKKIRVVYITGESYIDHSYTIIKELRKHLNLEVYFIFKALNAEVKRFLSVFNAFPVTRKRYRNPLSLLDELALILRLKRLRADCIWFNTLNVYQIFLVKIFLKNYLIMLHDAEIHPSTSDKHGRLSTKLLIKFHRERICTASYSQSEVFRKLTGTTPKVLPLPVIDYYKDLSSDSNSPDERKGRKLKFFFFGTIERYKGIDHLIDASVILEHHKDKFEINIYGKFRYSDTELFQRIKGISVINLQDEFIDYKQVSGLFRDNDVLILPYRQVTQCGPLLISYSFNVPVICSDHPGFREYVDNGKSGLIYGNSSGELAEVMEMIINEPDKIKEMKDYIKTVIHKKFSMESLASMYIKVLTDL